MSQATVLAELALDEKERRLVTGCLNGGEPLRTLYRLTSLPRYRAFAIIYALHQRGYLELDEHSETDRLAAGLRETIAQQHAKLAKATHFELLGVHWSSGKSAIDEGLRELERQFSRDRLGVLGDKDRKKAEEILLSVRETHRLISDDTERKRYRESVVESSLIEQAIDLAKAQAQWAAYRQDKQEVERLVWKIAELK